MKIREEIVIKAYEAAAKEQTEKDYIQKGYFVQRDAKVGRYVIDLIARKKDKVIIFEFKSGRWDAKKAKNVAQLKNYVTSTLSGEFRLVLVNPPKDKEIEIDGIEEILQEILQEDTSQVDHLATHITLEEVTDVDINSVHINDEQIKVTGFGYVSYELQYGSDSDMRTDDGLLSTESFPFTFRLTLDHDFQIVENEIQIDTSTFYE